MIWLMAYIVIAALIVEMDAVSCYADKKYFDLTGSIGFGLCWPISVPYSIHVLWKECKKYEKPV